MGTLVDYQIRALCRESGLVEPFDSQMVNPASIDVTLGNKILVENITAATTTWRTHKLTEPYVLLPGEFILAHTAEFVRVPNWIEANFQLKSSRGREGLNHLLAGYIDPGFSGRITLELQNVNRFHSITLYEGMRIGQLRFNKLSEVPLRSYAVTGRYMNDETVTPSKG